MKCCSDTYGLRGPFRKPLLYPSELRGRLLPVAGLRIVQWLDFADRFRLVHSAVKIPFVPLKYARGFTPGFLDPTETPPAAHCPSHISIEPTLERQRKDRRPLLDRARALSQSIADQPT